MGQLAVIDYPEGTSDICENQAMFAVTLRVIKELKIAGASDQISDAYIELAEAGYPMISKVHGADYANHNMDGIYYNGGSWMRIEICGYVAGKLHGWTKADRAIANRLWAETNTSADFPTSQEYLATDPAHPFFGYHRVFAWNSFVLAALEMAGLRRPEMDPDYSRRPAG